MALTLLKQAKIRYPGLNPLQDRKLAEWVLGQAHLQISTDGTGTPDMNNFICSSAVQSGGKSLLPQLNVNPTLSEDLDDNNFYPIHSAIVNGKLFGSACQTINCVSMSFNTSDISFANEIKNDSDLKCGLGDNTPKQVRDKDIINITKGGAIRNQEDYDKVKKIVRDFNEEKLKPILIGSLASAGGILVIFLIVLLYVRLHRKR